MKRIGCSLFVILLITILPSCKQDFDITSKYKEVPVVYGLLNWQETNHYIRIQKAYLIDGDATIAAGVADSIYYSDGAIEVKLKAQPNGVTYTLNRVDGNNIGLPKEPGAFADSPNILYTFNGTLDPSKTYRLEITSNESGKLIYAETALVKDFRINTPSKGAKLNLQNSSPARASWNVAENAGIYDLTIRFFYKEFSQSDNALLKDTYIDLIVFRSIPYDYNGGATIPPIDITSNFVLGFLAANLEKRNDIYREFNFQKGMQFKFAAGGTELTKYLNAAQAQSGLASNEALPPYSNLLPKGQVLGLLSSRYYKQVDSVLLSPNGLDSLACSDISRALRFKASNGQICN